jgi:hypothetical protein
MSLGGFDQENNIVVKIFYFDIDVRQRRNVKMTGYDKLLTDENVNITMLTIYRHRISVVPFVVREMTMCVRGIEFACFCDASIRFWNCSDGVVF